MWQTFTSNLEVRQIDNQYENLFWKGQGQVCNIWRGPSQIFETWSKILDKKANMWQKLTSNLEVRQIDNQYEFVLEMSRWNMIKYVIFNVVGPKYLSPEAKYLSPEAKYCTKKQKLNYNIYDIFWKGWGQIWSNIGIGPLPPTGFSPNTDHQGHQSGLKWMK